MASSPLARKRLTYDKILLFGDSLTELSNDILSLSFAITPALQHYYFRKLSVVARGYGGYNSEHLKHVLVPTIHAETAGGEKIRLLVIEAGTNDAALNDRQHIPVERYRQNLMAMVESARSEGIERIVVVGPGPVDEKMLAEPVDKSTMRNLEYSDVAKMVAEQYDVPFIDLWHAFMSQVGWKEGSPIAGTRMKGASRLTSLMTDGVHFSGEGYRIWYHELLKIIANSFPQLETENLPTILPHIFDIDTANIPEILWQQVHIK
jgi:lysophospholipase L1-like esterase